MHIDNLALSDGLWTLFHNAISIRGRSVPLLPCPDQPRRNSSSCLVCKCVLVALCIAVTLAGI